MYGLVFFLFLSKESKGLNEGRVFVVHTRTRVCSFFFFSLPVRLTSQLLVEAFDKPELVSKVTKQTSSLSLCQFWLQMYFKTP